MPLAPKRRWFAFSLRTMFIVVTVFGILAGWVAWNAKWISQRKAFGQRDSGAHFIVRAWSTTPTQKPSLVLFCFGEKPVSSLRLTFPTEGPSSRKLNGDEVSDVKQAQRLFPEAEITWIFHDMANPQRQPIVTPGGSAADLQ